MLSVLVLQWVLLQMVWRVVKYILMCLTEQQDSSSCSIWLCMHWPLLHVAPCRAIVSLSRWASQLGLPCR